MGRSAVSPAWGWPWLLIVATGTLLAGEPATDSRTIQGSWVLVSSQTGGETVPAESLKARDVRMVFEGDRVIARTGDKAVTLGTFALDPTKTPRAYDRVYSDGSPRKGIYRLEGDRLTVCIAALGGERPTAFATRPGDGLTLLVYRREKP